jgi:biopolymer transport protein ExbD
MSMSVGEAKGSVRAEINVTPMADIMIVLLIIFMLATSKIADDDRFVLPPALHALKQPESALLVKVTRGGAIVFGGSVLAGTRALEVALGARLPEGDQRPVQIEADLGLAYEQVAPVIDAARRAGAAGIVLRTQPDAQSTRNP